MREERAFLEQVTSAFDESVKLRGFRVTQRRYDSQVFGNALVVLERRPLRIRASTDRGDLYVDIASTEEPENWYLLCSVLDVIVHVKIDGLFGMRRAVELLEQHVDVLVGKFGPGTFSQTKQALEAAGVTGEEEHLKLVRRDIQDDRKKKDGRI